MLTYHEHLALFEITRETYENYIQERLKQSHHWNETQLMIIVETLVNFMNTVFEVYRHYPGNSVELFTKLATVNAARHDIDKKFIKEIADIRLGDYPAPIKYIIREITAPYQLCVGDLLFIRLNRGLQKHCFYTKEQMNDLHEIAGDLLNTAIDELKRSKAYLKAEQEGSLYYDLEQLKAFDLDEMQPLPSKSDLARYLQASSNGPAYKI